MFVRLKIFFTRAVLFVFLFVPAMEAVHAFEHRHDFQCSEKNEKHFHQEEHHCPACDYILVAYDSHRSLPVIISCNISRKVAFFSCSEFYPVNVHAYFLLRAPPASC